MRGAKGCIREEIVAEGEWGGGSRVAGDAQARSRHKKQHDQHMWVVLLS